MRTDEAMAVQNLADDLTAQFGRKDAEIAKLRAILKEAELQIEYLHDKFQSTSSGVAVLTRIRIALDEQKGNDE